MEKLDPGVAVPITHVRCRQCGHDCPPTRTGACTVGRLTRRVRVRQALLDVGCVMLLVLLGVGFFVTMPLLPPWK